MATTPVHDSPRHTRIATVVRLVEEAIEEHAQRTGAGRAPLSSPPIAAVVTDWSRSAPAYAALLAYAHAFHDVPDSPPLALVVPGEPSMQDRVAVSVLIDSLDPELTPPHVELLAASQMEQPCADHTWQPNHDDSDLLALARLCTAFHERAQALKMAHLPRDSRAVR